MNQPLISIVIPAYNRERYIGEAIESVLQQDYPSVEIIVVDDGSTDGTAAAAQRYAPDLRYTYRENGGIGAARNTGIALANGEFLGFLDSDDRYLPAKLSTQMAVFEQNPAVDIVFHHVTQFFSPELDEAYRRKVRLTSHALRSRGSTAMLLRRTTFAAVGPFIEQRNIGVDMEWYGRAVELSLKMVMLDDILYERRIHENNASGPGRPGHHDRIEILRQLLDRRRTKNEP